MSSRQSIVDALNDDSIPDLVPAEQSPESIIVDSLVRTVDLSPVQLRWLMLCECYASGGRKVADSYMRYVAVSNVALRRSLIDALSAMSLKAYLRGIADRIIGKGTEISR